MKIAICINSAWNLINFRKNLIQRLVLEGHEVIAVAPIDIYVDQVKSLGCKFSPIKINNHGKNPFEDIILFLRFLLILHTEKPDIILTYTIKPNIYGSFAAYFLGIPVVNNIAGLGTPFVNKNLLTRAVRKLYKIALFKSVKIFFQNNDDRSYFVQEGLVNAKMTDTLPGSGVDLQRFGFISVSNSRGPTRFLLIGRMLWDKGVSELVQATRQLKTRGFNIDVCLLGFLDLKNPRAIGLSQIESWVGEGVVSYLGETEDVRQHIIAADCIILPSFYREGVPRSLLEAASMGRPIITTDSVGCREVVDDGVNGFLCQPRNVNDLVEKMQQFIKLSPFDRAVMGKRSREKVECHYDENIVISKYIEVIKSIINCPPPAVPR